MNPETEKFSYKRILGDEYGKIQTSQVINDDEENSTNAFTPFSQKPIMELEEENVHAEQSHQILKNNGWKNNFAGFLDDFKSMN